MKSISFGKPIIGQEELDAVKEVLESGILVHGPKSKQFESDFAAFTGAANAVSVASCTAGLHLVYYALGLGPGDEVIVPAQTHVATAHSVSYTGAIPVFVDAEPRSGNIDINAVEAAITTRTKAISIVHFLGYPVDMDRINAIAARHELFVVEDAALAVGTYYKSKHAGALGDAGCFSFYPVKHMTTAEGGMILVKDGAFAEKLQNLKAFGLDRTVDQRKQPGVYDVVNLGFNYRMNEIEAAIGIQQLLRMPGVLKTRRGNYNALASELRDVERITVLPERAGESHPDFVNSCYCLSAVLDAELAPKRPEIVNKLKAAGIGSSVYYPKPVPAMAYYKKLFGTDASQFPVASWISDGSISLPVGAHLSDDDMALITQTLKKTLKDI